MPEENKKKQKFEKPAVANTGIKERILFACCNSAGSFPGSNPKMKAAQVIQTAEEIFKQLQEN